MKSRWHTLSATELLEQLQSSKHGLSNEVASERLQKYGPNVLPETKADGPLVIFFRQFQSPLIYILLVASSIVFAMRETIDGAIILTVLLFNAIIGAIQEGKAQNTLLALKKFVETKATVLRDGEELIIPDPEVVPGDVLILQEGERVAADARIILSHQIRVDEAALTGESVPVYKTADPLTQANLPTSEQKNMVFKGTHVLAGNGVAVVVATASHTVIGKIASAITAIDTEIPLKVNIRYLSRVIIVAVGGISTSLFLLGIALGKSIKEMFTTVVSLSVSIIPEGLPIVVTLVLATGVWRMSKRNALVKKLQAVEALGQARIIAVDKTGTITKNEMVVQRVYADGKMFDVSGVGYEPKGEIKLEGETIEPLNHPELLAVGKMAALCANARVMFTEREKLWRVAGDPTEAAMLVLARKLGFNKDDLEREAPLVAEIPFDYTLKYHATVHKINQQNLLYVAGAPEVILELCTKVRLEGKTHHLSKSKREALEATILSMSRNGLRVVALAETSSKAESLTPTHVNSMIFAGFLGMKDALRPEASVAVLEADAAGIRVVMITGDHKVTAQAIAREAGIFRSGDTVLLGQDIDALSDVQLQEALPKVSVFARVTPEHKLRIIKAYKARGEIVAMTGDGVNDAPSLVAADLGVAMGKIGTEVSKEASDIVLLDDNFGSIVAAVEEGRNIYQTLKKALTFLFSTGVGEVLIIFLALLLSIVSELPLPLLAAHILWVNMVGDGIIGIFFAHDPKEHNLLSRSWKKPGKYIIDSAAVKRLLLMAVVMAVGTLYVFWSAQAESYPKAVTMSFTVLAMFQWFNAWNCRSDRDSIFAMNPLRNAPMTAATIGVVMLQVLAIYNPLLQKILRTVPLELSEWLTIIPVAASIILVEEIRKLFHRHITPNPAHRSA